MQFIGMAIVFGISATAHAQGDSSGARDVGVVEGGESSYHIKVRHVFSAGFRPEVELRAVVLSSMEPEFLVGIREGELARSEVILITPETRIWYTELIEQFESGGLAKLDASGRRVEHKENPEYKALLDVAPRDYREIKGTTQARKIGNELASRIRELWTATASSAEYELQPRLLVDGVAYHFSVTIGSRGVIGARAVSPPADSAPGHLVRLVEHLRDFVLHKIDEATLRSTIASE